MGHLPQLTQEKGGMETRLVEVKTEGCACWFGAEEADGEPTGRNVVYI